MSNSSIAKMLFERILTDIERGELPDNPTDWQLSQGKWDVRVSYVGNKCTQFSIASLARPITKRGSDCAGGGA